MKGRNLVQTREVYVRSSRSKRCCGSGKRNPDEVVVVQRWSVSWLCGTPHRIQEEGIGGAGVVGRAGVGDEARVQDVKCLQAVSGFDFGAPMKVRRHEIPREELGLKIISTVKKVQSKYGLDLEICTLLFDLLLNQQLLDAMTNIPS